jgi:hypothetical protein
LEDGEPVVSAAGFRLVAGAAKGALRIIHLRALNGIAAKADTVVLKAGITEAVALANGKAILLAHVVLADTAAEGQRVGVALGEASNIFERSDGVGTGGKLKVPAKDSR